MHQTRIKRILTGAALASIALLPVLSLAQVARGASSTEASSMAAVPQGKATQASNNDLEKLAEDRARKTHIRFISSQIKPGDPWNAYMTNWVGVVERVGNENYPAEVRRLHRSGDVVVTTCILKDGGLASVDILRSSGVPLLDSAATRAIRLAAPFSPLRSKETWVEKLCITRTFEYRRDAAGGSGSPVH